MTDRGEETRGEETLDADGELLDEERELLALDRFRASEHQLAGGATRGHTWMMIVGGALGVFSSIQLVLAEMELLGDPNAALSCDISPVVGCGDSLGLWQSHLLFGRPNAVTGIAAFGMVAAVGVVFLAGARVARWFWQLMAAVSLAGLAFVAWFEYQSLVNIRSLCPWCSVMWVVVIPLAFETLGRAAQAGHLPVGERVARFLFGERRLLTIATFLVVIALIVVAFWPQWRLLLGF
ncbi:MAG TPA: vitamin K epoxide reductase family protein [Actinomycetaceae bacterium]|nr:vitamin K epoxide reductase family protein [Actinomycetaceae bacterium]